MSTNSLQNNNKVIRIAIADDHQLMIDGIKTALADNPEIIIVGEAKNGLEIIEISKTNKPDIIILDISMPELDGLDAAKIIKEKFNHIKIIILTQFSEKRFMRYFQKIGVEGYLLKECEKIELIEMIKSVYNGGLHYKICSEQNYNNHLVNCPNSTPTISNRELEVLNLLARDQTCNDISIKLGVCVTSIKTYRQRLKDKSGSNTLTGLVSWAYQNDLI